MRVRLKICCIGSIAEAQMAIDAGADALGLVGPMPSGPGILDRETLRAIAAWVPPPVSTFLLTRHTEAAGIIAHADDAGTDTVQLVDQATPEACAIVRRRRPGLRLVQVLHVRGAEAVERARTMAPHVHALLLDSGDPDAAVPTFGGTGKIHDWSISRQVVDAVTLPVFLAGGLRPGNLRAAVRAVRPFGVDVCSGLRPEKALDPQRLAAFVGALRAG